MQVLFEWDFNDAKRADLDAATARIIDEFAPGLEEIDFITELVRGVVKHQKEIDHIIEKAAPDWPLEQIAVVDRNVLRLGLFELVFGNRSDVPAKVAINEAIELAKTFGGETSGRFVNGVLGTIYKELGEPGKDEAPAKKKRLKDVPYEEMPIEKLGGALVYCRDTDGELMLALVHDVFGFWTLSKGHVLGDEDVGEATKREIKAEMGVDIELKEELGQNEYIASDPEKGKTRRQVFYFLAECLDENQLKLEEGKKGLDDVRWFPAEEVPDLRMYDDMVPIITKGVKKILGQ